MIDEQPERPKKKRKKKTTPTQRTLAECRKRGWVAQVVEQTIPRVFVKRDLFGCIDIVAMAPGPGKPELVAIQASAGSRADGRGGGDHAAHRAKILAEPRIKMWLATGNRFELWSWAKRGERDAAKRWTLRVEVFHVEDFPELAAAAEASAA